MGRERRLGLALLAAPVALGLVGDLVFHGRPLGLNVALFALAFVAALALLLRVAWAPVHQARRGRRDPATPHLGLTTRASPLSSAIG